MKNRAVNTLKYTGVVTLSQYIGSKKVKIAQIHNTGGNPLFNFLADCLIGDFTVAKASMPSKIMLLKRDESAMNGFTSLTDFIHLLTKPEKVYKSETNTTSVARYSFIISKDMLSSINNFDGFGIGLFTDGASIDEPWNYAAFCELNLTKNALVNSSLVVDWELSFSNVTTEKIDTTE